MKGVVEGVRVDIGTEVGMGCKRSDGVIKEAWDVEKILKGGMGGVYGRIQR